MRPANFYAAAGIDRAGHRRKDPDWVAERLRHASTRFVPVWRTQNLVVQNEARAVFLGGDQIAWRDGATVLLGMDEEAALFALDMSVLETPLEGIRAAGPVEFRDLRHVGPLLAHGEGSLLAYARGMTWWNQRHRFCGICGSPARSEEAGHVRRCTSESCAASHFPRTDPAVIMLVHDGERCLLGRQPHFPKGMHSTLAGFVEPGESLEEAVAREVREETAVVVDDVTYHSSQPWPFPASIMLGFYARAATTEIRVDHSELQDAHWYDRAWLLEHEDDDDFRLPRRDSIARRLIEDWLGR
jgi:NAD+ diphosphatase